MKKINKIEPSFFTDYLRRNNPSDWGVLSIEIGFNIRDYILSNSNGDSEQSYKCAYTEVDISPNSNSSHIDHFKKQSLFPYLRFDWHNLFVSTNNESYGAKHKDRYIKHEDYAYLLNPANEDPKQFLYYSIIGSVSPLSNDESSEDYKKAETTIQLFNLNHKSLKNQRLVVVKQIKSYKSQLSLEEIKRQIGKFGSFIDAIYYSI